MSEDGEATGENEGGDVLFVSIPAEGYAWSLEGFYWQDPPQGLRELARRHPPFHPSRRHLHVTLSLSLSPSLLFIILDHLHDACATRMYTCMVNYECRLCLTQLHAVMGLCLL